MKFSKLLAFLFFGRVPLIACSNPFSLDVDECYINDGTETTCSIDILRTTTKIYPGGSTACYVSTTSDGAPNPYYFQVTPGSGKDANKLLLHFQGGGFCASGTGECRALASPRVQTGGIFNNEETNPFKDWTSIVILYCSGDAHVGGADTELYQFRGRENVLATLEYVYANVPLPDRVVVTGTSAGSMGLHYWSYTLAAHYKALNPAPPLAFVMDSGLLGYSDTLVDLTVDVYGLCEGKDAFGWTEELEALCLSKAYFANELQLFTHEANRDTPFVFMSFKNDPLGIDYEDMQQVQLEYIEANAPKENNVVSYFANTVGHGLLVAPWFFSNTNGEGKSLLDLMTSIASYNETTTIQSSCSRYFGLTALLHDYGCNEVIADAAFQVNGAGIGVP